MTWRQDQGRQLLVCIPSGTITFTVCNLSVAVFLCIILCLFADFWSQKAVSLLTQITCHLEMKTTWSNVSKLGDWLEKFCDFHYNADHNEYRSPLQMFGRLNLVIQPLPSHNKAHLVVHAE